ncbi:MAG: DEAD/DEAH box helicase [Planctomycetia bacterium]|nr:DEAD/DEAH box helicase [Planctomycetia bacterium]
MHDEPPNGFDSLPLSSSVLTAVARCGYRTPTPIQANCIPHAVNGKDVIGQAQTGTGKTAAFLLPFFQSWQPEETIGPFALIMAPTRELVVQVADEAAKLTPHPDCRAASIIGGQRLKSQMSALKRGAAIVIGTPGRVIDHLRRGTLSLDRVRYVVLDEADRMLDIGFRPDIERILKRVPESHQTMLFSATMPPPVMRLTQRYMIDPVHVNVAPKVVTVDKIRQTYITVDEDRKFDLLLRILERDQPRQAIIFCERKKWVEEVYFMLRGAAQRSACMHGDLSQSLRNRIMRGFREGKIRFLVATDVVGRGIDVKNLSHVINYDLPEDPENYVHRIGRTGRIGADGIAIAFVTPEQGERLTEIETFINREIRPEHVDGFEAARPRVKAPAPEIKPTSPVYGRRAKKYSNRL